MTVDTELWHHHTANKIKRTKNHPFPENSNIPQNQWHLFPSNRFKGLRMLDWNVEYNVNYWIASEVDFVFLSMMHRCIGDSRIQNISQTFFPESAKHLFILCFIFQTESTRIIYGNMKILTETYIIWIFLKDIR